MSENYLVEKIIADARAEARKILKDAEKLAENNIAFAKKQAEEKRAVAENERLLRSARNDERQAALAQIEQKKQVLSQKTEILDKIFADVKDKLKISEKLINKYKKPGDKVTKIDGGVKISNTSYVLLITSDELLNALREEIETEVVNILFGGVDG